MDDAEYRRLLKILTARACRVLNVAASYGEDWLLPESGKSPADFAAETLIRWGTDQLRFSGPPEELPIFLKRVMTNAIISTLRKPAVKTGRGGMMTSADELIEELPLDPDFATVLLDWKRRSKGTELVFTSPATGRHFHASPAQQDYLRPAGWCLVECPHCGAAIGKRCMDADGETPVVHEERRAVAKRNKLDNVGWHTFRHTYRSWLDDTGAPMGVQQKLMRHADISTTAKYGDALMESKRKHNSIVVRRALGNE